MIEAKSRTLCEGTDRGSGNGTMIDRSYSYGTPIHEYCHAPAMFLPIVCNGCWPYYKGLRGVARICFTPTSVHEMCREQIDDNYALHFFYPSNWLTMLRLEKERKD